MSPVLLDRADAAVAARAALARYLETVDALTAYSDGAAAAPVISGRPAIQEFLGTERGRAEATRWLAHHAASHATLRGYVRDGDVRCGVSLGTTMLRLLVNRMMTLADRVV